MMLMMLLTGLTGGFETKAIKPVLRVPSGAEFSASRGIEVGNLTDNCFIFHDDQRFNQWSSL